MRRSSSAISASCLRRCSLMARLIRPSGSVFGVLKTWSTSAVVSSGCGRVPSVAQAVMARAPANTGKIRRSFIERSLARFSEYRIRIGECAALGKETKKGAEAPFLLAKSDFLEISPQVQAVADDIVAKNVLSCELAHSRPDGGRRGVLVVGVELIELGGIIVVARYAECGHIAVVKIDDAANEANLDELSDVAAQTQCRNQVVTAGRATNVEDAQGVRVADRVVVDEATESIETAIDDTA